MNHSARLIESSSVGKVTRKANSTEQTSDSAFCDEITTQSPARVDSPAKVARCNEPGESAVMLKGKSTLDIKSMCSKSFRIDSLRGETFRKDSVNPLKWLLTSALALLLASSLAQAGFWTFYLPNILKPSGHKEMSAMISLLESDINATKDAYEDHKYFWSLLMNMDRSDAGEVYPEESVCFEVFPMFRDLAIEYSRIDYEHFIKPLELHYEHLLQARDDWFPDGAKSKTILPREWEQKLHEHELELKLEWFRKLAESEELREKRKKMVEIWVSVKRGLDSSLPCLYLKYAYRQVAKDINQMALEMNVEAIEQALRMVRDAYKRIAKWQKQDNEAIENINESVEEYRKFDVKFSDH